LIQVLRVWNEMRDDFHFWENYAFNMVLFPISGLDESILEECLQYLEKQLESSQVRKAMEEFFSFRYILTE